MEYSQTLKFTRRNLPHWLVAEHAYFVTIRLKNTLPFDLIRKLKAERETAEDLEKFDREQFVRIEKILDGAQSNDCVLDNKEVAEIIINSFQWLERKGWVIYAATVLSTHVHFLIRNFEGLSAELLNHLARFKNYTARRSNEVLGLSGHFWAREDFDHWIRTPQKFESTVRYIANNPVKAGKVQKWDEWPWTVLHDDVRYCLDD